MMTSPFDRTRTLQDLEPDEWPEPEYASYLVITIHRLRRKPLNEFTVEDLRIMIGQNVGLPYLIPIAIERLAEDPLIAGDFYRGDLMKSVLSVKPGFWKEHPELWWRMEDMVTEVERLKETIERENMPAAANFRSQNPDLRHD